VADIPEEAAALRLATPAEFEQEVTRILREHLMAQPPRAADEDELRLTAASIAAEAQSTFLADFSNRTAGMAEALNNAAAIIEDRDRQLAEQKARRLLSATFACRSGDCPQPFALHRHQDVTGVSGSGTVAHGVQFSDGTVVLRWLGDSASTVVWDSLETAMKVHGHDGKTQVVWLAAPFSEMGLAEKEAAAAERERIARLATEEADRGAKTGLDRIALRAFAQNLLEGTDG
jgi:hypothetical protein